MPKYTQQNRPAAVGTPLADDYLLLKGMSGVETISQPFRYTVEMLSEDPEVPFDKLIGESLTIRLNHADEGEGEPRFFNGIVADLRQLEPNAGLHRYEATVVPWLWFLTKVADCRIFQQMTVPEILAKVFKTHGFEDFQERLSGTYPALDYCVQYRETDFDFVSRLMEEVGIYYFFTHEDGKHTMVLADSRAAHDPCPDFEEIRYVGPTANTTGTKDITRWEQRRQVNTGKFAIGDYNFAEPKKRLYEQSDNEFDHNLAQFEHYTYAGEYTEEGGAAPAGKIQLADIAKIRLQALQAEHVVALGDSDCRGLCLGHTFELKGCFRPDQDGGHFITGITHQIDLDDYVSSGRSSGKPYLCSFSVIPDSVDYRPACKTRRPLVSGPQTAVVVGRAGEEIDTDEFGRVKVQFHWDREGQANEKSSCWVRVSQNWAGKKWGAFFIPRIGQEVIVEFLEGDPDRPIITGRVYNGDNKPPYDLPAEKTKSTIKSNSSKDKEGHNELRFEDKAGQEQIYMHAEKDMDVRVKNNYKETNYGHRHIRVGWEKDGNRGGDFNTLVRYDENRHIENDHYEMVDKDSHQTIKGERTEKFEKSQKTFVQEDAVLNADNQITETKTAISLKTDKYTLQGATGVHLKSQTINLEATNISLKCGGSFVHIGPAGVDIKGPMVKINSGGSAQSAEDPKALPEISVLEPLDASVATNSKAGSVGSGVARSVQRGGGVIAPHLAPDWILGETLSATIGKNGASPSCPIVEENACSLKISYTDQEDRPNNSGFSLAVVPPALFNPDIIKFKSEGNCQCVGAQYRFDGGALKSLSMPIKVDGWVAYKTMVPVYDVIRGLPEVSPKPRAVEIVCGKDGNTLHSGVINVYPSDEAKLDLSLQKLIEDKPKVKNLVYKVSEFLQKVSGNKFNLEEGCTYFLGPMYVKVGTPDIKLSYQAQWREHQRHDGKESEVYYYWKFSLGLSPFLDVSIKADIVYFIMAGSGVAAPLAAFYGRVRSYLNDDGSPPLYIGLKGELKGELSASYEEGKLSGGGAIEANLSVILGGQISKKYVEASAEAEGPCENKFELIANKDGPIINAEAVKLTGVKGKVQVKINCGRFFSVGWERKAQLIEGSDTPWWGGQVYP